MTKIGEARLILLCENIADLIGMINKGYLPESYLKDNSTNEEGEPTFDLNILQYEMTHFLVDNTLIQEKIIDKMAEKLSHYMTKMSDTASKDDLYANGHVYMSKEEITEKFKQEVENEIQTD